MNHALFVGLCLALGSSYAWTKIGLEGFDPLSFVLIRLLVGALVLAVWMRLRREPLVRLPALGALGLLNVLGAFLFLTWGIQYVESSYAAILVASGPIFSALGGAMLLPDEGLDARRTLGVALGFTGVVALVLGRFGGDEPSTELGLELAGAMAITVSAIIIAAVAIIVRLRFGDLSAAQIAMPQLLAGSAAIAVLMLVSGASGLSSFQFDPLAPGVLVSVLVLGFVNAGIGNLVYYRLVLRWGVTRTALVGYVAPFIGAAIGVRFLDEHLEPGMLVGLALVTLSLVFVNRDLQFSLSGPVRPA